jgi:hypothetical protein
MGAFVALLEMLLQSFICNCNIDLSENFFLASKVSLFVPDFQAGAAVASGQPSLCLIRRLAARAGIVYGPAPVRNHLDSVQIPPEP